MSLPETSEAMDLFDQAQRGQHQRSCSQSSCSSDGCLRCSKEGRRAQRGFLDQSMVKHQTNRFSVLETSTVGSTEDMLTMQSPVTTKPRTEQAMLSRFVPHAKSHSIGHYLGCIGHYLTDPSRTHQLNWFQSQPTQPPSLAPNAFEVKARTRVEQPSHGLGNVEAFQDHVAHT